MSDFTGRDAALLRYQHGLRQVDVGRAMRPPVSRQRVHQLEHAARLAPAQLRRLTAGILAAVAERGAQ